MWIADKSACYSCCQSVTWANRPPDVVSCSPTIRWSKSPDEARHCSPSCLVRYRPWLRRRSRLLALEPPLAVQLAPLLRTWPQLHTELAALEAAVAAEVAADPVLPRLQSVPDIGPVTALAFVATLADPARFRTAAQVQAYLGLVPREHSSADGQHRGRITKTGPTRLRWLLVEAAWRLRRTRRPEAAPLQAWMARIAHRRGRHVAIVALARKLAGILFALWRDGTTYHGTPPMTP